VAFALVVIVGGDSRLNHDISPRVVSIRVKSHPSRQSPFKNPSLLFDMAAYIQVCPHVFDEEKSNLPPRQVRLSVSVCIMTNLTTFYFSLLNSCNIVSIRFPYSSASSKANMISGVFLKRI